MNILDLIFPVKCPVCGRALGERQICGACRERMPLVTEPCCRHCGKPVLSPRTEYCRDCSARESFLDEGTALWIYTEKMKRVMADFKYGGCEADAGVYADELLRHRIDRFRRWRPDYLVPVPLHRKRRWFRGYNQAEAVAEHVGRAMGIPVAGDCLIRARQTRPQKELDDVQRRENVRNAIFPGSGEMRDALRGSRVMLIDDIYTTGATLEACGKVLRDMGVCKVYFACLCIGQDY